MKRDKSISPSLFSFCCSGRSVSRTHLPKKNVDPLKGFFLCISHLWIQLRVRNPFDPGCFFGAVSFREFGREGLEALIGYLRDGRFEIDNNLVENSIRPTAVGRRRWLFIGHPQAGWRSAVIYSLLLSCRRRGINPQDYLTDVLGRLPSTKITQIQQLLPAHWKPPSANTS